jgi:hypothetical protein
MSVCKRLAFTVMSVCFLSVLLSGAALAQLSDVQIIHNSADTTLTTIDVYVNNALAFDDFAFRAATAVIKLSTTATLGLATGSSTGPGDIVKTINLNLDPAKAYVLMVAGLVDTTAFPPNPDGAPTGLNIHVFEGLRTTSTVTTTDLLGFHGVPDGGAVDLRLTGRGMLFEDLSYGNFTNQYETKTAIDYLGSVNPNADPFTGIAGFELLLSGLADTAAVVFGSGWGTEDPNLPAFGMYAAFPDGTVLELPGFDVAAAQLIMNSPEQAYLANGMDIFVDGVRCFDDFGFRSATIVEQLPFDAEIAMGPPAMANPSQADKIVTLNLSTAEKYVLMVAGVVDTANTPANPEGVDEYLDLMVYTGLVTTETANRIDLLAFHGTPNAPATDIRALETLGQPPLFSGLQFKEYDGYIQMPSADYTLYVTPAGDSTNVGVGFVAPFDGVAGGLVLFMSGYLVAPAQLPIFGLFAAATDGSVLTLQPRAINSTVDIKLVHNAPDPQLAAMDIYYDGVKVIDNFRFREAVAPFGFPPLAGTIGFADSNSTDAGDIIAERTLNLNPDIRYILAIAGALDPSLPQNPDGIDETLNVYAVPGLKNTPDGNNEVAVVGFHGIPDAEHIDIRSADAGVIFGDIGYTDFAGYVDLDTAGVYLVRVTPPGAANTTLAAFSMDLAPFSGNTVFLFASGYVDEGNMGGLPAPALFLCTLSGTIIQLPEIAVSDVQFIHNSPDPTLSTIDIYVDGDKRYDDFTFREASTFDWLLSDAQIDIAPSNSTGIGQAIKTLNLNLDPSSSYVAMVAGVIDSINLPPNPNGIYQSLDLHTIEVPRGGAGQAASPAALVGLTPFHGAPDANRVDIRVLEAGAVPWPNMAFRDFGGYTTLTDQSWTVFLTPAGDDNTILAGFTADLTSLGGSNIMIFASGYLANNPLLPDFGLFVASASGGAAAALPATSVPTLLQSSSIAMHDGFVELRWVLSEIDDGARFDVMRRALPDGRYEVVPDGELSQRGLAFTFRDRSYEPDTEYRYRVDVIVDSQRWILFESSPVNAPMLPLTLYQNYPNPVSPFTTFAFYLPEQTQVQLDVYDVAGRRVASLVNEQRPRGKHTFTWDGRGSDGRLVASGTYFYKLTSGSNVLTKKLVVVR